MQDRRANKRKLVLIGSLLSATLSMHAAPAFANATQADPASASRHPTRAAHTTSGHATSGRGHRRADGMSSALAADAPLVRHATRLHAHHGRYGMVHLASNRPVLQCVPFARAESGIALKGNAAIWWDEAEGVYARGHAPEPGSILNFRANSTMRLGHVAVVTRVINAREIEIDHAHWAGSGVSRNILVADVSPANDWTSVRVALGHGATLGSTYPTYGFIYNRPAGTQTTLAAGRSEDEVAEAPPAEDRTADAPDRRLR